MFRGLFIFPALVVACSGDFDEKPGEIVDTGQESQPTDDPLDIDNDDDGYTENEGDCDDFNNTINPDAEEVADNGVDEDCDGVDETTSGADIDNDSDGFTENEGDCDDNNNTIHPGMSDTPDNGIDEDCDGEDATVVVEILEMEDVQTGDLIITEIMNNPSAVNDDDGEWFEITNTSNQDINLNGLEIGDDDGVDDTISEDLVIQSNEHLVFGINGDSSTNGGVSIDYVYSSEINLSNSSDEVILSFDGTALDRVAYDSTFPTVAGKSMSLNPDQTDNALNDNGTNWCYALSAQASGDFGTPGESNDDCAAIVIVDNDGDTYEDEANGGDDCDDNDASINPDAVDVPDNGIDEDCDGSDATSTSSDLDGDGYDDIASGGTDCDDNDASINPGMLDIGPDGIDNNCDGSIDENGLCSDNCSNAAWNADGACDDGGPNADYAVCSFGADCSDCGGRFDLDGDTYYDDEGVGPLSSILEMDCDDNDASINPGMLDIGMDGIDQDCSGFDETGLCNDTCSDADDGYCDDGGPYAQYSICSFGSDCSDCGTRNDDDGDGYYDDEGTTPLDTALNLDCDDSDATISPAGTEIPNDGIDQDCSGADEVVSSVICDDTCSTANDGVCDDGGLLSTWDNCALGTDCSDCGDRYDDDGDGYDSDQDCNDSDPTINPAVTSDTCDGIDNDCDGYIDQDLDTLEPNNSSYSYYLGDLDQVGDTLSVTSYMTHENDEDAFSLFLFDNTEILPPDADNFYCEFTPPVGLDVSIEVFYNGSSLGVADNAGSGQAEAIQYNATWLFDDEGTYTFVVSNVSGSSCSPMTVYCEK
jgi:hypothetical protein